VGRFYLQHSAPKDEGAIGFPRRFPFASLEEAVAQAKHDLSRPGSAPLVEGIFDEEGERLLTVAEIEKAA